MDPANFKLLQVTFHEEELSSEQELDAFSTVVNYDSQFPSLGPSPVTLQGRQNVDVPIGNTNSFILIQSVTVLHCWSIGVIFIDNYTNI